MADRLISLDDFDVAAVAAALGRHVRATVEEGKAKERARDAFVACMNESNHLKKP